MTSSSFRDYVPSSVIAKRLDLAASTVSNWRRRDIGFPAPIGGTPASPLFEWDAVLEWYQGRQNVQGARTRAVHVDHAAYFWSALDQLHGAVRIDAGVQMAVEFLAYLQVRRDAAEGPVTHGPAAGTAFHARHGRLRSGDLLADILRTEHALSANNPSLQCVFKVLVQHPGIESTVLNGLLQTMSDNLDQETDLESVSDRILSEYRRRVTSPIGGWSIDTTRAAQILPFVHRQVRSAAELRSGDGSLLLALNAWQPEVVCIGLEPDHAASRLAAARALIRGANIAQIGEHGTHTDLQAADAVFVDASAPSGPDVDTNWFRQAVDALAPGGRAYVLVDQAAQNHTIRLAQVEALAGGLVEAIIALPQNPDGLSDPAALWILRRENRRSTDDRVLMLDAGRDENAADESAETLVRWRTSGDPAGGVVVTRRQLTDPGAHLDPTFWVAEVSEEVTPERLRRDLRSGLERLQEAWTKLAVGAPDITVDSAFGPPVGIRDLELRGDLRVVHGAAAWDGRSTEFRSTPGDLLIEAENGRLTVTLADRDGGRPRRGGQIIRVIRTDVLNVDYLKICLENSTSRRIAEGSKPQVQFGEVPVPPVTVQEAIVSEFDRLSDLRALAQDAIAAIDQAAVALGRAVSAGHTRKS